MVRFFVYQDQAREWRWRLIAANNYIVAVASEGYSSYAKAVESAQWVKDNAPSAPIE
jgi:uncharacterized protein YegP (UPF0339 family)